MRPALLRRSLVAAATITLLTIPSAFAETIDADTDLVTAGAQNVVDLGTVQPGADVPVDVFFTLTCSGTSHVNSTQLIKLTPSAQSVPSGGAFGLTTLTFGLGSAWPADGEECPAGLLPTVGGPNRVTVTAPTTPGNDYQYIFKWTPTLLPPTSTDSAVFGTVKPTMTFLLDVPEAAANTAPTLNLPSNSTVEGNTTGGATAAYVVSASDAEDATAPTPSCSPAVGDHLSLGANTITCKATDADGAEPTGSFQITVVDTTPPVIANSADVAVEAPDATGATVEYAVPTAVDVVDPAPVVGCSPASGTKFPVGATTVTCIASDASGNQSSTSFKVTVTFVPLVVWSAVWGEPVGMDGSTIAANAGRTIPVKVDLFANGTRRTRGNAALTVTPCGGGAALASVPLLWDGSRWTGHLDTGDLGTGGCFVAVVTLDGHAAGSFRIDLRGATAAPTAKANAKAKTKP